MSEPARGGLALGGLTAGQNGSKLEDGWESVWVGWCPAGRVRCGLQARWPRRALTKLT